MIFDTHAHYDDEAFDNDREEVLDTIRKAGIGMVTDIGADIASTKKAIALSEQYSFIYVAAGIHPSGTDGITESDINWLREAAKHPKVVAIGEIGLDYHYENTNRETQKKWLIRQLALARETNLPVCVHSRDAAQDTLDIIKAERGAETGGVIHCFSYGWDIAKIYLDMGFYLGIGGVVTFKNAKKLREVVQKAPIGQLVLETDAPYLAPEPYRGRRNTSQYLPYVAKQVAELRGITAEEVIQATWENGRHLYHITD